MKQNNVFFSEASQAGHGTALLSGAAAFAKLKFDAIYSQGFENFDENKPYRHAEIVCADSFPIESCLSTILCRNSVEQRTLLNLLKEKNQFAYRKHCNKIKVYRHDTFENNGLYVSECLYHQNTISISFSDTFSKRQYTEKMKKRCNQNVLKPIRTRIELCWFNAQNTISKRELRVALDYECPRPVSITNLPNEARAKSIGYKKTQYGK